MPCVAVEFVPPPQVVLDFRLSILAADLETYLTYTLLPCVGFELRPIVFFLGQP